MDRLETSFDESPLTPSAPLGLRSGKMLMRAVFVLASATIVWLITWLAISSTSQLKVWTINFVVPSACVILFVLVVIRQEQKWVWPVHRVNRMLSRIRAGELPIDSLSSVSGGLLPIARQVQLILHELRLEKMRVLEISTEMSQRIASRTDALERQIGTLRQQAIRDSLTGLYNRRMLDQFLPQAIEKCRGKADLSLLMIDVDYFKGLNDTLGHAAGDELLRNIGQIIRSTLRTTDVAFRLGGDELVVLLVGCPEPGARAIAGRLQSLVLNLTKPLRLKNQPKLSIGIATLSQMKDSSPRSLLEEADKRLYEIKSARAAIEPVTPFAKSA
jgi:diguanylate cyclase (GGDEF)-like protein